MSIIFNTGNDNLLPLMRQIAAGIIKYYPDHVESMSNIALTYPITGEFDKGLPYLLKAEEISTKDIMVLNKIAEVYKRQDDKTNVKRYLEIIISYGNKEEVQIAKEKIKNLQ